LIEPYKGKIYDPCCGSGGMFVQSVKFVESHQGNTKDISIYGQEGTSTTLKLAKMNLAIRGISGNLGVKADDTFAKDQHPDLKADFIMANPPFNQKDWRASDELTDDPRWAGYEVPPTSNANYAWILQMVSKLSENGMAGFILANGALSDEGQEYQIRRALIEKDLVEAVILLPRKLFYTTDISVTLWILNKNKRKRTLSLGHSIRKLRDRDGETLFIDMRRCGIPFEKKYTKLTNDEVSVAIETFHTWREIDHVKRYSDVAEYCCSASLEDIRSQEYSLVPSRYIKFNHKDWKIDYGKRLEELQREIDTIIQIQKEGRKGLIFAFEELGYEIQN
jgi:type I restriction enzyme M protein